MWIVMYVAMIASLSAMGMLPVAQLYKRYAPTLPISQRVLTGGRGSRLGPISGCQR